MTVLQVCAYAARYGGNFIASLQLLEQRLAQKGIRTEYLFPDTARDMPWCKEIGQRATVHFAGMNRFSPATYRQVARAMAGADIVHSHFELYDCITALAAKKGQKLFWHLHDSFEEQIDLPHRIINRLQYGVLGRRAKLLSPNDFYSDYVAKLGFPKDRIFHVDNGLDFRRLQRQEIPDKKWEFFAYGGFWKIKGLDVIAKACRILKDREHDFRVGIVGYPQTWQWLDENFPDWNTCIERLEPSQQVSQFYESAGAFLCTSRRECFSYALLEALYMGLPAIISDIPGNTWAAGYGSTLLFPSGDAEALANAMEQRLTGRFAPDTAATAKAVEQAYGAEGWAARIEEIYFD